MNIELGYTGDYPGTPYIRLDDRTLTDEQEKLVLKMLGATSVKDLFVRAGATKLPGSQEYQRWSGSLTASISHG